MLSAILYTITQTSGGDPRQCNSLVITASDDKNEMPSWWEEGGGGGLMDLSRAQALTKLIYKLTVQTEWLKNHESVTCWKLLKYCTIQKCA